MNQIKGGMKIFIIRFFLLLVILFLFTACDDGTKMVMVVPPCIESYSPDLVESSRIAAAYFKAVHNVSVLLHAGDDAKAAPAIKVVQKNLKTVRQAFVNRRYQLLHDYCEKNGASVIFYTQIISARAEGFFQVETHFFDHRSGGVYHFRPYMNVDADALYLVSFWELKLKEMYRKLSGEKS